MRLSPLAWPEAGLTLARTFGVRGTVLRLGHEVRRRRNAFRPQPRHLPTTPGPVSPAFLVDAERLAHTVDRAVALERADRVMAGSFQAFRAGWRELPDSAEAWLRHPLTGVTWRADQGWWRTAHLDRAAGDIKELWEPGRFGWAYDLVRAYLLTADDRYAAAFHGNLERWLGSSPAFRGPHWSCGQETAIRAIAVLYAEANLRAAPSSTPEAMARIGTVLAASGERIADAIGYAVSQRNNHAISEAVGLVALGVRFAGCHAEAARWLRRGQRLLERLVREQFAPDGWYIQHSFTYTRLALDQCVIAARCLRSAGKELSPAAAKRLGAALDLLLAVIEPATGVVPNHGANDGAFVHPITVADYRDFRPIATAVAATIGRPMPSNLRPDGEVLAWLGLPRPESGPPLEDHVTSGASGWAAARIGRTAVFLRAGRYRSRPGHLDPLHLDVRLNGCEMIVDPGTYAYNAPAPWRNGLAVAAVHNGPMLDGREPGLKGPRFLWYRWPRAVLQRVETDGARARLVAIVPGEVRRTVGIDTEGVVVEDEVLSRSAREVRIRWLLHPDADARTVAVEGGGEWLQVEEGRTEGWFSPAYGVRLPAPCLEVRRTARFGRIVRTTILEPSSRHDGPGRDAGGVTARQAD